METPAETEEPLEEAKEPSEIAEDGEGEKEEEP